MKLLQTHMDGRETPKSFPIGIKVVGMRFKEIWLTPEEVHDYIKKYGPERTCHYMHMLTLARVKTP